MKFQDAKGTKSTGDTNTESESKTAHVVRQRKCGGKFQFFLKIEPTEEFECADVVYGQEISNCVQ